MIGRKKKRNKKEKSLSWKGTSTLGTPQLNSLGWIVTTTQGIHISTLIQLNWSINTDKHSKLQSHGGGILSRQVNKLARPTEATKTSLDLPLPFSCIWDRLSSLHSRLRRRRHVAAWMMRSELRSGSRAQQ